VSQRPFYTHQTRSPRGEGGGDIHSSNFSPSKISTLPLEDNWVPLPLEDNWVPHVLGGWVSPFLIKQIFREEGGVHLPYNKLGG
jgi:hypothetical protein